MKLMTWHKAITLLIIITYLAGCTSLVKITPQELNNLEKESALITLHSDVKVKIKDFYITSDTLFWESHSGIKKYVDINNIKEISFSSTFSGIYGSILGGLAGMGLIYISMYEKPEAASSLSFDGIPFYYAFASAGVAGAIGGSVIVGKLCTENYIIIDNKYINVPPQNHIENR